MRMLPYNLGENNPKSKVFRKIKATNEKLQETHSKLSDKVSQNVKSGRDPYSGMASGLAQKTNNLSSRVDSGFDKYENIVIKNHLKEKKEEEKLSSKVQKSVQERTGSGGGSQSVQQRTGSGGGGSSSNQQSQTYEGDKYLENEINYSSILKRNNLQPNLYDGEGGSYFKDHVEPKLSNQDFFVDPSSNIQIGAFQSKTLGTVPIFAGGAAQLVPMAAFQSKKRALQDLLARAAAPPKREEIDFEMPEVPEVNWRFDRKFTDSFMNGLNGFISSVSKYGADGFKILGDPSTREGLIFQNWLEQQKVLASEINGIVDQAVKIEDFMLDETVFLPEAAVQTMNRILSATDNILNGEIVDFDLGKAATKLRGFTALPTIFDNAWKNVETDIMTSWAQKDASNLSPDGKMMNLKTDEYYDFIAQYKKEFYEEGRIDELAHQFSLTSSLIRAEGQPDYGQPFTEKELKGYMESMIGEKLSATLYTPSTKKTSVNVTVNSVEPKDRESFPNQIFKTFETISNGNPYYVGANNYAIPDELGVNFLIEGNSQRVMYGDNEGMFDALAKLMTKDPDMTDMKISDAVLNYQADPKLQQEMANRNKSRVGNFDLDSWKLSEEDSKNISLVADKIFEGGGQIPINDNIRIVSANIVDGEVKNYKVLFRENENSDWVERDGVVVPSNMIEQAGKSFFGLKKGKSTAQLTGGGFTFYDKYNYVEDKSAGNNYTIKNSSGTNLAAGDAEEVFVDKDLVKDFIYNEYESKVDQYSKDLGAKPIGLVENNAFAGKKPVTAYSTDDMSTLYKQIVPDSVLYSHDLYNVFEDVIAIASHDDIIISDDKSTYQNEDVVSSSEIWKLVEERAKKMGIEIKTK